MDYVGTAQLDCSNLHYAVVSNAPYTFEGYTHIRVHFDYARIAFVNRVQIKINGNIVYSGSDYSDKYYTISTGSNIEAYTVASTSSCDGSNPAYITATITVYK